jgi:malate-CoA ligase subunit beta
MSVRAPVVARLAGTNLEEGARLLDASGLTVERAEDLGEAARMAVAAAARS